MINNLYEEVKKELSKQNKYVIDNNVRWGLLVLFYLKYLCDKKKYKFEDVIRSDSIEPFLSIDIPNSYYKVKYKDSKLNKLLSQIENEDLNKLIIEYINYIQKDKLNLIDDTKKKIVFTNAYNLINYDKLGKTTYISYNDDLSKIGLKTYQLFDEMLKVKNKYLSNIEDAKVDKNTLIYLYDDIIGYRYRQTEYIISKIYSYVVKNRKTSIILETEYKRIAKLKYESDYSFLNKVLIMKNSDTVYLYFNYKKSDLISIIMYDEEKIKSIDKLKEKLLKDRRQKDVLIKVSREEVKSNSGRIGFKIYQDKDEKKRTIQKIVDENSYLTDKLSKINDIIKEEINKLINK